jgi:hypothetical protein
MNMILPIIDNSLKFIEINRSMNRSVIPTYYLGDLMPAYNIMGATTTTTSIKFDYRNFTKIDNYPFWIEDNGREFSTESFINEMSQNVLLEFLHNFHLIMDTNDINIIEVIEKIKDEELKDYIIFNLDIFGGYNV